MFNSKRLLCVYKHTFHITVLRRGAFTKRVFAEVSVMPLALVISIGYVTKYSQTFTISGREVFFRHSFDISL